MARKSVILQLALATIIGMPMVALLVDHFSQTVDLRISLIGDGIFWRQLLYGSIAGFIIAVIAQLIITSPLLSKVNTSYANLIGRFNLTWSEIIFVSMCAGVGEELLFRGAIQPFLGIPVTSVFFVAIHGYLTPKNWRLSIYGVYMTAAIAVLGYFTERFGLLSAIAGHTVIDIYLLHHLQKNAGEVSIDENQDIKDEEYPEETF
jgi:uncharacterized protein